MILPNIMRLPILFGVLIAAIPLTASAGPLELRPDHTVDRWDGREAVIDPDFGLYGVPFGSSRAEVIAAFGDPRGVVAMKDARTAFMYGCTHLLIFESDRLTELVIEERLIQECVGTRTDRFPVFDGRWTLKHGVYKNMPEQDVVARLKEVGISIDTDHSFKTEFKSKHSTITLRFGGWASSDSDEPYVFGLAGLRLIYHGD